MAGEREPGLSPMQSLRKAPCATAYRLACSPRRLFHPQEFQSKDLLAANGLSVQQFAVVSAPSEAYAAAQRFAALGIRELVIKAQVLAGGRGKGHFANGLKSGIHLLPLSMDAVSHERVAALAEQMLGQRLVTAQTAAEGVLVETVMIAEAKDPQKEAYLAIVLDRNHGAPVIVVSDRGGVDIEKVAHETPELVHKTIVPIDAGPSVAQLEDIADKLGFGALHMHKAVCHIRKLYEMFVRLDAIQIEINPFVLTLDGQLMCFDAKLEFDDNASFRHPRIFALHDPSNAKSCPREAVAQAHGLSYIGMEGSIGCLVNGAGLAMATMDLLTIHGGRPANFLDVGGSASASQISAALNILLGDPNTKAIFVNIFGGIMRCDVIAAGMALALQTIPASKIREKPVIVRLAGTNARQGREILEKSGFPLLAIEDLEQAAVAAVRASRLTLEHGLSQSLGKTAQPDEPQGTPLASF